MVQFPYPALIAGAIFLLGRCPWQVTSFTCPRTGSNKLLHRTPIQSPSSFDSIQLDWSRSSSLQMSTTTAATLTEATTWKIRFVMRGLPTEKGRKVDEIFNVACQFIEEEGYEPPQGYLKQMSLTVEEKKYVDNADVKNHNESFPSAADSPRFQIVSSRWKLSEDPNDRKWGLWVWGLFEEPLYPFLLLQVQTEKIPLPGEDNDAILPLALFAQVTHKRDKEKGAILSRAELKVRQMETVNADLFGVATADVYEEKTIGQCVFQPLLEDE